MTHHSLVRHEPNLGFTIAAVTHQHMVEFKIYDLASLSQPYLYRCDRDSSPEFTESLDEAEIFVQGRVKWDGCSDWYFDEQDRAMIHGCSRSDIQRLGDVLSLCWDWTAELCPEWDPQ